MTQIDPLVLTGVSSFEEAVRRVRKGKEFLESYSKIGFWPYGSVSDPARRTLDKARRAPLPTDLGGADGSALRDLHGQAGVLLKWSNDMVGVLQGLRTRIARKAKRAEAAARQAARKALFEEYSKRPSSAEVEDHACGDQGAIAAQDELDFVDTLLAAAKAQAESYSQYCAIVSRAMTLEDTSMKMAGGIR